MDPVKVQAITDWPIPNNLTELRSFLGFGNYYKDFIPNYSRIARPLHDATKKDAQITVEHYTKGKKKSQIKGIIWGLPQYNVFKLLKALFTSYPVLRNPDPKKPYILDTDASQFAIGAVLSQKHKDGWHPIAYFSKTLLLAERNYDIYNCELLAIIYAVKAFKYLFLGARKKFQIRTDHQNLTYFKSP